MSEEITKQYIARMKEIYRQSTDENDKYHQANVELFEYVATRDFIHALEEIERLHEMIEQWKQKLESITQ